MSIITAPDIKPEVESADRDPGIISLLSVIIRALHRGTPTLTGRLRTAHQQADEAALFSSSSAWPYDRRAL